jgi:cystathionine gamma-lyase
MTRHDNRFYENRFETLAIGAAENATHDAGGTSDFIPPLHLSSTFRWASGDDANKHDYSRESNPTHAALRSS